VGFYLWLEGDLAWAQGAYEYRPMGAAVISASDLFRRRDFSPRRLARPPSGACQYASLGHLNAQLQQLRARAFLRLQRRKSDIQRSSLLARQELKKRGPIPFS
jgi:hypothetical protein